MPQERQAPYKASLRKAFQKGLSNKGVANELIEVIVEMQAQMNTLLTKLDLDIGVADVDYSDLAVEEIDPDASR